MRRAAPLAAVTLLGCTLVPTSLPDWVAHRQPLPACGEEVLDAGGGAWDVEARTCLFDAYQAGAPAELVSTGPTVEGDPVTQYVRVHENGVVEIFVDATRDRFGSGQWERLLCRELLAVEAVNDPPDVFYPAEVVFVEDGCEQLPLP